MGEGVTQEEVLDGVYTLGMACIWVQEWDECEAHFWRAKEGSMRLLGEDHDKSVGATVALLHHTTTGYELIAELRALMERVKVSPLPGKAVSTINKR